MGVDRTACEHLGPGRFLRERDGTTIARGLPASAWEKVEAALRDRLRVRGASREARATACEPRNAQVLVEDRREYASTHYQIATDRPVEPIRVVFDFEGAAATFHADWYQAGQHNGLALDDPGAALRRILLTGYARRAVRDSSMRHRPAARWRTHTSRRRARLPSCARRENPVRASET